MNQNSFAMPFIHLQTNMQLSQDKKQQLLNDLTDLIAKDLNKPSRFIMARCSDDQDMMFADSADPLVFIELRSIRLPGGQTANLSQSLTAFVDHNLGVKGNRIFINFMGFEPRMWWHNGSTF